MVHSDLSVPITPRPNASTRLVPIGLFAVTLSVELLHRILDGLTNHVLVFLENLVREGDSYFPFLVALNGNASLLKAIFLCGSIRVAKRHVDDLLRWLRAKPNEVLYDPV